MDHDLRLPGPVVSLVPLAPAHAEPLAALGDADAYAWHTAPPPLTSEAALASIARLTADPTVLAFAVTATTDAVSHRRRSAPHTAPRSGHPRSPVPRTLATSAPRRG